MKAHLFPYSGREGENMESYRKWEQDSSLPWVLFLHGWGQNKESLFSLQSSLATFCNTIYIDLPGFCIPLYKPWKIEDYLLYIRTILQKEKIKICLIVGHSFGGKVASFYASRIEDVPLILLAPSMEQPRLSIYRRLQMKSYHFLKKHSFGKLFLRHFKGSRDYQKSQGDVRRTFLKMIHTYPKEELFKIHHSVYILWGEEDEEVRKNDLKKAIKRCRSAQLITIKGNHFAYRRNTEYIGRLVQHLLENEL